MIRIQVREDNNWEDMQNKRKEEGGNKNGMKSVEGRWESEWR